MDPRRAPSSRFNSPRAPANRGATRGPQPQAQIDPVRLPWKYLPQPLRRSGLLARVSPADLRARHRRLGGIHRTRPRSTVEGTRGWRAIRRRHLQASLHADNERESASRRSNSSDVRGAGTRDSRTPPLELDPGVGTRRPGSFADHAQNRLRPLGRIGFRLRCQLLSNRSMRAGARWSHSRNNLVTLNDYLFQGRVGCR